jgi:hypothetical protein
MTIVGVVEPPSGSEWRVIGSVEHGVQRQAPSLITDRSSLLTDR